MYPYQFGKRADYYNQPFFFILNFLKKFCLLFLITFTIPKSYAQTIDVDELLERLDRIEKNISDIQKGKVEELEKSLSTGYISRNESKLGDFETKIRTNFGLVEEIDNKIQNLDEKLNLIDKEFQSRINKIEKNLKEINSLKSTQKSLSETLIQNEPQSIQLKSPENDKNLDSNNNKTLNEDEIKKKI
jgi:tetrahydromethanopterin S-methyltransferase subunit G